MRGERARSDLAATRFGDLRWVPETGSTNDDLLAAARAGAGDGSVLVADHQTAGRGRLDRGWVAPPGSSLLVSVLLRPEIDAGDAHLLATGVGVCAVRACAEVAGLEPSMKWPNDLVVAHGEDGGYRKLGGILAESVVGADGRVEAVVVGLGLNVAWGSIPAHLEGIATSLDLAGGGAVDREDLLVAILRELDVLVDALTGPDGSAERARLLARYRACSATLGRRVRVELAAETFEGTAVGVTDGGHLVVEVPGGGPPREVVAGDVVHLRH